MKLKSPYLIKPHTKVRLSAYSTDAHDGFRDEASAKDQLARDLKKLAEMQEVLYASQAKAILIVLQGMDTAGKDGAVRHIFSGINPAGCNVSSFKVPTTIEARHDFLWRCHAEVPPRGMIGIFNRSHYEEVLSPVVHGKTSAKDARRRMDDINEWERMLADQDVVILKFFLHISHAEQTRRLQARIDTPDKRWKLSPADFEERKFWSKYCTTYENILRHTSQKDAPWFVIPSDHKWYRDVAISQILVEAMKALDLKYPKATFDPTGIDLADETAASAAKKAKAREDKLAKDADTVVGGKR